ncbi:hypothetical protein YC2023_045651 [Brassica napus]
MADENNEMKEEKDEQEKKKKNVVIQHPIEDSTESQVEKSDSLHLHANDGRKSSFTGLRKKKKKNVEISSS